jgi:hypothetical protein
VGLTLESDDRFKDYRPLGWETLESPLNRRSVRIVKGKNARDVSRRSAVDDLAFACGSSETDPRSNFPTRKKPQ